MGDGSFLKAEADHVLPAAPLFKRNRALKRGNGDEGPAASATRHIFKHLVHRD